jgi:hypothetical protein
LAYVLQEIPLYRLEVASYVLHIALTGVDGRELNSHVVEVDVVPPGSTGMNVSYAMASAALAKEAATSAVATTTPAAAAGTTSLKVVVLCGTGNGFDGYVTAAFCQ